MPPEQAKTATVTWVGSRPGLSDSWARWLVDTDPRMKVVLTVLWGGLTWKAGPFGLALYGLILACPLILLGYRQAANAKTVRAYTTFVLGWMILKLILELWAGADLTQAGTITGILGLRLIVLLFLGLVLAQSTSPRRLGFGLSWFLKPILRQRAWQVALALALMVHFIPLIRETLERVKVSLTLRAAHLPWRVRQTLFLKAVLRIMSQKTYRQAVAIAARGLDSPEKWQTEFSSPLQVWLMGLVMAGIVVMVAWA